MYCQATLDSFESQSISNFRGCRLGFFENYQTDSIFHTETGKSDMNQTCSGPMVKKNETIRRVKLTDEQLDEYQLGK